MECATNVNDLCLHNNAGLDDKLGKASAPTTKPGDIDGETPCGVDGVTLPFCEEEDDDEDEIFFGQVSNREQHNAQKFADRRTALFVQGFRNDRRLMRHTIGKKRSQCEIGSEEYLTSERGTAGSLSSISEENNNPALASETSAGTGTENDSVSKVTNGNGRLENEALATGNSEVCGSDNDRHVDACNLLHFFASVCALEPHQDSCETNAKDEMMVLEKATRDSERDRSGDAMTGSDTSSTDNDETSVNNTSCTEEKTDDSRDDEEENNARDSDDSCVVIINTGCGNETESESCDTEADVSELEVNHCVGDIDTSRTSDTKANALGVGCVESKLCKNESESLFGLESEVNESATDDEISFGPVRHDANSEENRGGRIGDTGEMSNIVNGITCEISQMELNTVVVSDTAVMTGSDLSGASHGANGHDAHGSVTNIYQQSTAECFSLEHSSDANFPDSREQSNNASTPGVPLQRIHNAGCSAFQMYQKQDTATSEGDSNGVVTEGTGKRDTNGSKELSVKLDFDSVVTETGYTGASSISHMACGFATSFTCVTPIVARGEFGASSCDTSVAVATPTFIPPTPHTTSILGCPSLHGCHGDSVAGDFSLNACSQESSNHSLPCFASPALALARNREESHDLHTNLPSVNLAMPPAHSCHSTATRPMPSHTFTPTKVIAMVTPTVNRNIRVASPSVVFTERNFSPTPMASRQFRDEMPFGGNFRPAVSDYEGEDVVQPTPSPSLVFTGKHYSPTSMSRTRTDSYSDRHDHGDTVDADSTSKHSPQIVFKVHNFSPVVIRNDAPRRRVPACEKTCGSTKCEHCATVVRGNIATSPRIAGKTRPVQRLNRLKLKKITSFRKTALSPCKKTPTRSQPGGSTTTPNRCKQHVRPSPSVCQTGTRTKQGARTPICPGTPVSDGRSQVRQVKEGNLSTPLSHSPVHRQDTPRHKIGSLGSKLTKVTCLPLPWGQRTPSSIRRGQPQRRTESDSAEVSQERRSQLKQSHRDTAESPSTPSAPRGLRAAFSPGVPKMLRMYDTPLTLTPTSADHLPRVRYKEKGLNQVQLDAITQLHTLCNSQQAARYITRPRVGGAVKRVAGKECSRLSWQEDQLSHVPEDKHVPPPLEDSPTPKSILNVKPLTQLYPYSEDPLSPVVIHKTVRKTNTLAQAVNKG